MLLKRLSIAALGVATVWPLIHVVLFLAFVSLMQTGDGMPFFQDIFPALMASHVFTIVLMLFLVPIYIARVFDLPPKHAADRTAWMLAIIFLNVLGMLVFLVRFELPQWRGPVGGT